MNECMDITTTSHLISLSIVYAVVCRNRFFHLFTENDRREWMRLEKRKEANGKNSEQKSDHQDQHHLRNSNVRMKKVPILQVRSQRKLVNRNSNILIDCHPF